MAFADYAAVLSTKTWSGNTFNTSNPGNGTWVNSNGNWNGSGVGGFPNSGDNVVLGGTQGNGYTVTLGISSTPALDSLNINFSSSNTSAFATLAVGSDTLAVNGGGGTISLSNQADITITTGVVDATTITLNNNANIADGTGNINATTSITLSNNADITIAGGNITTGTLTISNGAGTTLSGYGKVTATTISGNGDIVASISGQTLDLNGNIAGTATNLQINTGATLEIPEAVTSGAIVNFDGNGTLELTSSAISGGELGGFTGNISGLTSTRAKST